MTRLRLRFSIGYALAFVALLAVEVCIALYVHDRFVRPFVGDVLVVVLMYCFVRTCSELSSTASVITAFAIACAVEVGQYFDLVHRLHVAHVPLLRVALGTHFDPLDFVAYGCGALVILAGERIRLRARSAR